MKNSVFLLVMFLQAYCLAQNYSGDKCGITGSIKDRINDCMNFPNSQKGDYVLVSRIGGQNNIYKDMSIGHIGSGLLWVGPFKKAGNYRTATINCYELSNGQYGIKANWRIPTYFEFVNAYNRGLKKQFPNVINTRFWTSTPYATAPSDKHYYVIGIRGLHEQPQLFVVHGETSSEANYCVMRDVNFDWAGLQSQNEE